MGESEVQMDAHWYTCYEHLVSLFVSVNCAELTLSGRADIYGLVRFGRFRPWCVLSGNVMCFVTCA